MSFISEKGANGPLALQVNGLFNTSTDANLNSVLGTRYDLSDGREVILVSCGNTAISTAGVLCQDAAILSNHQNLAVVSYTAYSANGNVPPKVVATTGATALLANQYQGGYLLVNAGPGIGNTLRVSSHNAYVASTNATFILEEGANVALTTSSKVCLIPPHGKEVVVNPTTSTGAVAGVTLSPLSAGTTATPQFGFLASKGVVSCLSDATVASVGQSISPSVATVGAVTQSGGTGASIGYANQTAVSAEARSIFIDV